MATKLGAAYQVVAADAAHGAAPLNSFVWHMLHAFLNWGQISFWVGLACLAAGIATVAPFLLSKSFRTWFSRADVDLESIGLVVLALAVAIIGLYNTLGR